MRQFEHAGLRLAYDVFGEGLPVVLHTGAAGDSRMWRDAGYVDGLAGFRIILLDHRGHGQSEAPSESWRHTVADYAGDVLALADELGLSQFAFWGYSDGGCVGIELAAAHPTRSLALVVSGGVGTPEDDSAESTAAARLVRESGIRVILGDEPVPDWLICHLADETEPEVVARELECFAGWSPWPRFGHIRAPTMLVAGELESEHLSDACAVVPNCDMAVIPNLGHIGAFLHSELVLPHVVPFLRSVTIG